MEFRAVISWRIVHQQQRNFQLLLPIDKLPVVLGRNSEISYYSATGLCLWWFNNGSRMVCAAEGEARGCTLALYWKWTINWRLCTQYRLPPMIAQFPRLNNWYWHWFATGVNIIGSSIPSLSLVNSNWKRWSLIGRRWALKQFEASRTVSLKRHITSVLHFRWPTI